MINCITALPQLCVPAVGLSSLPLASLRKKKSYCQNTDFSLCCIICVCSTASLYSHLCVRVGIGVVSCQSPCHYKTQGFFSRHSQIILSATVLITPLTAPRLCIILSAVCFSCTEGLLLSCVQTLALPDASFISACTPPPLPPFGTTSNHPPPCFSSPTPLILETGRHPHPSDQLSSVC